MTSDLEKCIHTFCGKFKIYIDEQQNKMPLPSELREPGIIRKAAEYINISSRTFCRHLSAKPLKLLQMLSNQLQKDKPKAKLRDKLSFLERYIEGDDIWSSKTRFDVFIDEVMNYVCEIKKLKNGGKKILTKTEAQRQISKQISCFRNAIEQLKAPAIKYLDGTGCNFHNLEMARQKCNEVLKEFEEYEEKGKSENAKQCNHGRPFDKQIRKNIHDLGSIFTLQGNLKIGISRFSVFTRYVKVCLREMGISLSEDRILDYCKEDGLLPPEWLINEVAIKSDDISLIKKLIISNMTKEGYTIAKTTKYMQKRSRSANLEECLTTELTLKKSDSIESRIVIFEFEKLGKKTNISISTFAEKMSDGEVKIFIDDNGKFFKIYKQILNDVKSQVEQTNIENNKQPDEDND